MSTRPVEFLTKTEVDTDGKPFDASQSTASAESASGYHLERQPEIMPPPPSPAVEELIAAVTSERPSTSVPLRSSPALPLFTRTGQNLTPLPNEKALNNPILSREAIRIDWAAISAIQRRGTGTMQIDLGNQDIVTAEFDRISENAGGGYSLSGRLRGHPDSSFVASRHGEALVASLRRASEKNRAHEIVVNPEGVHEIRKVDTFDLPPCHVEPSPSGGMAPASKDKAAAPSLASTGFENSADETTVVDVMVLYTKTAREVAGGTDGMIASINHIVENANVYFIASGVSALYRLVHTHEIDYDDSSGGSIASHLADLSWEGGIPEAHSLRDTHGADIVILMTGQDYGGRAYRMTTVSSNFEGNAFGVIGASYTSTLFKQNYLFSHECGHIFGCDHDWLFADGNDRPFPYSYGSRWTGNDGGEYLTIMSTYYGGTLVYQFSNPDSYYQGLPTGTSTANNALTINNTKATVAAFRNSVSSIPVLHVSPRSFSVAPTGGAYQFSVVASDDWTWERGSGSSWVSASESSPQTGSQLFQFSAPRNTGAARTAQIIVRSGDSASTFTISQGPDTALNAALKSSIRRNLKKLKKKLKEARIANKAGKVKRFKKKIRKLKKQLRGL